jgi:hypothetical protein
VIIIITIIISILGLFLSIQTIVETRKKYYKEYLERKKNELSDRKKSFDISIDNKTENIKENNKI